MALKFFDGLSQDAMADLLLEHKTTSGKKLQLHVGSTCCAVIGRDRVGSS